MKSLPNFVVLAPSDEIETKKAIIKAVEYEGPVYIRVGRKEVPSLFKEEWNFEIGKGYILKEGCDIALIAHGSMVYNAYRASEELSKKGVKAMVVSMPSIKPIDKKLIIDIAEKIGKIITLEDHFLNGGLYSSVCEVVCSNNPCKVLGIGVDDVFGESGSPEELYEKYGLGIDNIIKKALEL